jgi:hypothetical protein
VAAAFKIRQATLRWRPRLAAAARTWGDPRPVVAVAVVVAAVVAVALWGRDRRPRARRPAARTPPFYARALKTLARRGFRPDPGETAREFAARVTGRLPGTAGSLHRLTGAYERARFGAVGLSPETLADLDRAVAQLRAAVARPS